MSPLFPIRESGQRWERSVRNGRPVKFMPYICKIAGATLIAFLLVTGESAQADKVANNVAVFAGLDKITARITSFEVRIDETVQFGALQVTPRVCYTRTPNEPPLTSGFVEVNEVLLNDELKRIFTGWMFASSPGIHAVEHPVFDVWLTDCRTVSGEDASSNE